RHRRPVADIAVDGADLAAMPRDLLGDRVKIGRFAIFGRACPGNVMDCDVRPQRGELVRHRAAKPAPGPGDERRLAAQFSSQVDLLLFVAARGFTSPARAYWPRCGGSSPVRNRLARRRRLSPRACGNPPPPADG